MRRLFIALLTLFSVSTFAQTSANDRDSVANTSDFQKKVKISTLVAANNILADTAQQDYTIRYAQLIISQPNSSEWLTALSYGFMTNPAINYNSPQTDFDYTITTLFVKYAKAYYRVVN